MNTATKDTSKALIIGSATIVTYIANYFLRNMLSVLTPAMLNTAADSYNKEYIAFVSSCYLVAYAAGQLLNGVLGDVFNPKYLALTGVAIGGVSCAVFPLLPRGVPQYICFALLGYGLSMVRGPLMKIISENTLPSHARTICVFFSFSSFIGPLIASLIALLFQWQAAFTAAGITALVLAVGALVVLSLLERRGLIQYRSTRGTGFRGLLQVFKVDGLPFFLILAILLGIYDGAVFLWVPTFLNEHIGLSEAQSNLTFSVLSLACALTPFAALAVFRIWSGRDAQIMRTAYGLQLVLFLLMLLLPVGWWTVLLLALAMVSNSMVSANLWSNYIPSLGKTGRVSSINGILDCTQYITAGVATSLFTAISVRFGYGGLIAAWTSIPTLGIIVSCLRRRTAARNEEQ